MNKVTCPFESLKSAISFSSRDWAIDKRDAWIYGIIIGWNGDYVIKEEELYREFNNKFGWDRKEWNRLKHLHDKFTKYYNKFKTEGGG
jgi:hypothetical protein